MKKVLASLLLLVSCMFCLTACGDGLTETYWLDTSAALTTYFDTNEDFNKVLEIDYCDNIDTIIASSYGELYKELTDVYAPLFEASIFTAQKYANVLKINPIKEDKGLRGKIVNVNSNLETLSTTISDFIITFNNYEEQIDFTAESEATSEYEKGRLLKFKQEYLKVIEQAYKLSESLYDAYVTGYYDFADFNNMEAEDVTDELVGINKKLALNGVNLQLNRSAIKILAAYNAKEIKNTNNKFWESAKKFFNEIISSSYESIPTGDKATILNNFKVWKGVYTEFIEDSEIFNNIVDELNIILLNRNNDNAKDYAKATGNHADESKVLYFFDYHENISLLYTYTNKIV